MHSINKYLCVNTKFTMILNRRRTENNYTKTNFLHNACKIETDIKSINRPCSVKILFQIILKQQQIINMLRVKELIISIAILAILYQSQADDDNIEFYFESDEGITAYRSSCHNFTLKRQLSSVTIGAFNKTEGFIQCFCSLRSTYTTVNVSVRIEHAIFNDEYWLEAYSTIDFKLTYADTLINGYIFFHNIGSGYILADGVTITADGVLDLTCNNESYPNFSEPQLSRPHSTMTISSLTSSPESECKDQPQVQTEHSHNAIYAAIAVITILLLSFMIVLSIVSRRKLVMLQNTLNKLSPSVGLETGATIVSAHTMPNPGSMPEAPYEDVSNPDTNDRNTATNTESDKATLPAMPEQNCNIECDILSANTNAKKELNKQVAVNSQAVSSVNVRLYEPLDIYANAETDPSDKYAQLSL